MASQFQQESLKQVIAQVCQTIGFQGINSTPLDVMIDLLHRYIKEIAISTHRYSEHAGRTTPNLDDLSLTFKEMGISVSELEEYVTNVEPTPYPYEVPKVPVPRPSNLNFLKPGAREIVSRPLCIHEHLPPMYPEKEEEGVELNTHSDNLENDAENGSEAKSPISPSQIKRNYIDGEMSPSKKFKISNEEEGEPVREIDSVMMTTSGFISSAREGKYPEAKRPNIPMTLPRSNSPTPHKIPSSHKKKASMEKIIWHKNHPGGIMPGSLANPKSKEFKLKPKIPSAPPGTGSLKYSRPGGIPPKLKIPVPKVPTPKLNVPKNEPNIGDMDISVPTEPPEKKRRRDRDRERRREKSKESKKEKKDERPKKERNRDDKKKREKAHHNKLKNERTRIRSKGLTKEEELRRYKERENELIAALAASSAVTVTSIPPPSLRVREISPDKSPDKTVTSPQDGKSKLSIFKKLNKSKDGDTYRSRENSPILMIDDVKEEPKSPPPSPTLDYTFHEEPPIHSPPGTPSTPRTPDILPTIKNKRGRPHKIKLEDGIAPSPVKKSPKVKKTASPRGRKRGGGIFSPTWRHPMGEITPDRPNINQCVPDRPKTPESVLTHDDIGGSSFNIPSFPNAPGFIPPFSRFTFGPFGNQPIIPPVLPPPISDRPNSTPLSRVFINSFNEKVGENMENRPPTPSHEGIGMLTSPVNKTDNVLHDNLPPLQEASKILTKDNHPRPVIKSEKLSKIEKEKKKEHKKEKKEKEKLKKKKEKKDKEKAKEEKKREKERLKQEKKDKRKRGRKRSDTVPKDSSVPKITFKMPSESGVASSSSSVAPSTTEQKQTPKLVIKPVLKHPNDESKMLLSLECKKRLPSASPPLASPRLPSIKLPPENEPGSPPEIAKFSPLITRPPKLKLPSKKSSLEILTVPPLKIKDPSSLKMPKSEMGISSKPYKESHKDHKDSHREHKEYKDQHRDSKESHKDHKDVKDPYKELHREYREPLKEFKEPQKDFKDPMKEYKETTKDHKEPHKDSHKEFQNELNVSHHPATVPPLKIRNAPSSKLYEDKKFLSNKKIEKKDKEKRKKSPTRITPPPTVDNTTIKITSLLPTQPPPCPAVTELITPRLSTPTPKGSRKSVIVPSGGPPVSASPQSSTGPSGSKTAASGLVTETVGPIGHFVDDQGNEVWICPTCGKQDDGSPMIGCDTCDDWYHWLCVGIHVPPSERENWYCPRCLSQHKQKGLGLIEKKKRGRKRKFPVSPQ